MDSVNNDETVDWAQVTEQNHHHVTVEAATSFKEALAGILTPNSIISDPAILEAYSGDCSYVQRCMPYFLVYPESSAHVQAIVRLANEHRIPLVPVSSGLPRFRGDTVPGRAAAIVDFSRMHRILKIDPLNRCAMIEPGVRYGRLIAELKKHELRFNIPLLPRATKSVAASILEREPGLIPKYQFDYLDPLLTLQVIYGTGDEFRTGSASGPGGIDALKTDKVNPWGPGMIDYIRFLSGAQGTMGLVTWITTKVEVLPPLRELHFIPIQYINDLTKPMIRLLKQRVVDECLALNRVNLAAMLAENWPEEFEELKANLPCWTILVCVAGYKRRPEERVEIQRKYLKSICSDFGLKSQMTLPGAEGKERALLELLSGPWEKQPYWKLRSKESSHDIFFLTTLSKVTQLISLMNEIASRHGYPVGDIGCYVQPMVQGRGCHCEFNLTCDESCPEEAAVVKKLFLDASDILMKNGAFFSRPYGPWADMAYRTNSEGVVALNKLKRIFDPNNILNPGKLCF